MPLLVPSRERAPQALERLARAAEGAPAPGQGRYHHFTYGGWYLAVNADGPLGGGQAAIIPQMHEVWRAED